MNIDFLTEKFNHIFRDFSPVKVYFTSLPSELANSDFQITGKLLDIDDFGVNLAFLFNGNEIRIFKFPHHVVAAVQVDASEVMTALREMGAFEDDDE